MGIQSDAATTHNTEWTESSAGAPTPVLTEVEEHVAESDPHPQYLTQAEADALYGTADALIPVEFYQSDTLSAVIGGAKWYNDTGRTLTIQSVRGSVRVAPTGADIIFDLNINDISCWTLTTDQPKILIGTDTSGVVTDMDFTTVANGSYLSVDLDQVGSMVPGTHFSLVVVLI